MKYLIGMDVGTSRIKAVLFDLEGNEQKIAYRDNEPIYEGSHSEQDMNMVWDKSLDCLKEVVEGVDKDSILGIGVTGQGEGCWLIDKDGKPVSNAILWNDGRAKDLVDEINSNKELSELIYKTTGTPVLTGTALTLLKWSKENRKEVLDRADKLFFCKDWVRYNLTGEKNLELTDTATSLMNVQTKEFAYELLDALELGEYKHLLSPAIKPYEVAATITDEIAEITGLNKDTPVIGGAIDVMATVLGAGAINNGDTCSILGTTCATMIVSETCEPGKENTRFELHPIDDLYVNLQPTMSGTPNIDWVVDNISDTRVYKEIDEKIKDLDAAPSGVIYHPYLSTAGERSPFYNANARSSFFGMNTHTTRYDLVKAVYEGIAFSIKDCLDATGAGDEGVIYLAGGGAESKVWAQIISDCTGRKVAITNSNEIAAKGVAIMLGVTLGVYESYEDAVAKTCRATATYEPDAKKKEEYNKLFEIYKELRLVYDPLWNKRRAVLKEIGRGDF